MTLAIDTYPNSLIALQAQMDKLVRPSALAKSLFACAIGFDMARARNLGLHFRYQGLKRNGANPVEFEHPEVIGMAWADKAPILEPGETWNAGRRATLTGKRYENDAMGRPINPYMNTGMSGRGTLGLFGPNHAVDNGIIAVREEGLSVLGITRKYDGNAPAMAGGFAKFERAADGSYDFDAATEIRSRADEFFEEMISGSVPLLPEFEDQVETHTAQTIDQIESQRGGQSVASDHRAAITEEVRTELKMAQVAKYDPGFLKRLHDHIALGQPCFAGPVLCDPRNTNTSWIESRMACVLFNDSVWESIKGDSPAFDYAIAGGDDASGAQWHMFSPTLMSSAFASHGAMMVFLAVMYMTQQQLHDIPVPGGVVEQLDAVESYLSTYKVAG